MVPSITTILQRFTGEWATLLQPDAILAVCSEIGYTAWRSRVLTPVTTIPLFLLQLLHGHTACSHLPHLSGLRCRAAADCQARARLPLRFFNLGSHHAVFLKPFPNRTSTFQRLRLSPASIPLRVEGIRTLVSGRLVRPRRAGSPSLTAEALRPATA
jgi:hypothetical protein